MKIVAGGVGAVVAWRRRRRLWVRVRSRRTTVVIGGHQAVGVTAGAGGVAGRLRLVGDRDVAGAVGGGAVVVGIATRAGEEIRSGRGGGTSLLRNGCGGVVTNRVILVVVVFTTSAAFGGERRRDSGCRGGGSGTGIIFSRIGGGC